MAGSGKVNMASYYATRKRKYQVPSIYGYEISCEVLIPENIYNKDGGRRVAILSHGLGCAKYDCIKYADIFLKLGFVVILYDHRNHGLSGKAPTSMGYYEMFDLKKIVDWCYKSYGENIKIVTHGESMGAATVLMHLGIDQRVSCAIADCSYSDLKQLLIHQLKQFYHLPRCIISMGSILTFVRAGFSYRQVSPMKVVRQTNIPIMFIHGKKDNFVPTWMSKEMYSTKKDKKALYLVAGARHAESCLVSREGYEKRVREFLRKYMK